MSYLSVPEAKTHSVPQFIPLPLQIFQTLEHPLEIQMLDETRARLNAERDLFMRFVFNGSWNSVTHRHNIDQRLVEYEKGPYT